MNDKVKCKLCSCEGVKGTVLCREHLDGYEYAVKQLATIPHAKFVQQSELLAAIEQQKGEDNGKSK
jgi:hypothetical protein